MRTLFALCIFLAACGGETPGRGTVSVTAAGGKVVAYDTAWDHGYVVSPRGGARAFGVGGVPTAVFATPDRNTALFVDPVIGKVTAVDVTTGTSKIFAIRTNRDAPKFSPDSRYVLWHASGDAPPTGTFDPNELSLIDLVGERQIDLSVGANPKAVAFYTKAGDPRMLLFSPGKMTQIRIEQLMTALPTEEGWKATRDLSPTVRADEFPRVLAQSDTHLYLVVNSLKEFLSIDLTSKDDLPPVNFEINDVKSPVSLALGPPVPATAETVFFRDAGRETRFLYVLNANKTITVFDAANLGRSRILDLTYVADAPDTVVATSDGKRVLAYRRSGAKALYRMNVRTGNIATIPFKYPVSEFIIAPDGESVVALHEPSGEQQRQSFTYVNFTEVFDPILLPQRVEQYALTEDGRYIVFRFAGGEPMRRFDLKLHLLDEERSAGLAGYGVHGIGSVGEGVFAFLDDPTGRVVFLDLAGGATVNHGFLLDGILDR